MDRRVDMADLQIRPLNETTWPDFARLVEAHYGLRGGCWCMAFHAEGVNRTSPAQNRSEKERRVREGQAHAALVYDGPACVGWCQFGPTDELPRIKHRRAYLEGLDVLPDWRITLLTMPSLPSPGPPWCWQSRRSLTGRSPACRLRSTSSRCLLCR